MKGKAHGVEVWRERVERWRASGLSLEAFAEREGGFSWRSLQWWRWRIEKGYVESVATKRADGALEPSTVARKRRSPPFVPVIVEMGKVAPASPPGLEVVLQSGHAVRVPVGFDRETLARLVDVLRAGG